MAKLSQVLLTIDNGHIVPQWTQEMRISLRWVGQHIGT